MKAPPCCSGSRKASHYHSLERAKCSRQVRRCLEGGKPMTWEPQMPEHHLTVSWRWVRPPPTSPLTQAPGLVLSKLCQPLRPPAENCLPAHQETFSMTPMTFLHLVFIFHALPRQLGRPSIASGPALRPSSLCGWRVSPRLETAYQGPHVIRLLGPIWQVNLRDYY